MTTLQKQRLFWLIVFVLAVVYFAPSVFHSTHQVVITRPSASRPALPAQPGRIANPLPASGAAGLAASAAAAAAIPTQYDSLIGIWQGAGPQPGLGMCNLRLELRRNPADPSRLLGFPVLACAPIMPLISRPSAAQAQSALMSGLSPMSAVLTGTVQNGALQFSVDRVMGNAPNGCALTSFTVTPFGNDLISAEWHEGGCQRGDQRGQILLKRMGR